MSIRARIYFGLTLLLVLLLVLLGTLYMRSSETLYSHTVSDAKFLLDGLSKYVVQRISFVREDMQLYAAAIDLGKDGESGGQLPGEANLRRRFISYFEMQYGIRLYDDVILADAEGNVLAGTRAKNPANVSGESWWPDMLRYGVSQNLAVGGDRPGSVGVAVAIRDETGRLKYVLHARLGFSALVRGWNADLAQLGILRVDIATPDGMLIYSSRLHRPSQSLAGEEYFQRLSGGENDLVLPVAGGRHEFIVSQLHRDLGRPWRLAWRTNVHLDYERTFAQLIQFRWWMFGSSVLFLVLGVGFLLFLMRTINSPLTRLVDFARHFGAGERHLRLDEDFPGEFGELTATINTMAESIDNSYRKLEDEVRQRKEAENQLATQALRLKRSNEDLEQFAYVASHDLQEPLRIVTSYLQLLRRRASDSLDEDANRFIDSAVSATERMRQLIRSLLAFSRVKSKAGRHVDVDLNTVMENVSESLRMAVEDSGADLKWDRLPMVHGEESQMHQLMQNLVGNALKFRGERSPVVRVSAERDGDMWRISVKDNGIGFEQQYQERIFSMFQRLHSRSEYEGTGIGLTLCRRIVERHGGKIWSESEPGLGATFHFTITAAQGGSDDE